MMMTSGGTVHYKSMFDAGSQIIAKEGTKSLFKGAGANILRGVAGAGVLSLYDKFQQIMFGKVYSGGRCQFHLVLSFRILIHVYRIRLNTLVSSVRWLHGVSRSLIDLVSHLLSYFHISGDILLALTLDTKYKPGTKKRGVVLHCHDPDKTRRMIVGLKRPRSISAGCRSLNLKSYGGAHLSVSSQVPSGSEAHTVPLTIFTSNTPLPRAAFA